MTPSEQRVVRAAIRWWRNHRPMSYDQAEHLRSPAVNTKNDVEKSLARAVATLVRSTEQSTKGQVK